MTTNKLHQKRTRILGLRKKLGLPVFTPRIEREYPISRWHTLFNRWESLLKAALKKAGRS